MQYKKFLGWAKPCIIGCWYAVLCLLAVSALWSGYRYQYNGDELLHAQQAFFLTIGFKPFGDYFSIYTPIFHWLIAPTMWMLGTTLQTLHALRGEMIVLFVLELILSVVFLSRVYGKRVAVLFVGLILLDPFTTYAGMQIRPDTLMMALFVAGLCVSTFALDKNRARDWFFSGLLLSLSVLTAIKIVPAIVPVIAAITVLLIIQRRYTNTFIFLSGFVLPWILFVGYFASIGLFVPMLTQLTVDIKYLSTAIQYPTHFGFFYQPDNANIYGVPGKPLTWVYVWLLPMMAAAGAYGQHIEAAAAVAGSRLRRDPYRSLTAILPLSMVLAFLALFVLTTAFVQYYITAYWFFAVFTAIAFVRVWDVYHPKFRTGVLLLAIVVYMLVARSAIAGNIRRAEVTSASIEEVLTRRWRQIPANEPVFPYYLFRPAVYPIAGYTMGDVPNVIRRQFISPESALSTRHVRYILLDEYGLSQYDESTQIYIHAHYTRVPGDADLMIRTSSP